MIQQGLDDREIKIMVGAGGTSGHINPAITIADYVTTKSEKTEIVFCGLRDSLEEEIVRRSGYEFKYIRARVLPNNNRKKMRWILENTSGIRQCVKYVKKIRPDIIISTGSYVGSPLVFAGLLMKVPVLLHEQNALPGRSNRLFGHRCDAVCISFEESKQYFKDKTNTVLTGNPIASKYFTATKSEAREKINIDQDIFHIVIMGGSLGASTLNQAVMGLVESGKWLQLIETYPNLYLTISTGMRRGAEISRDLSQTPHINASEYIFDGADWMASADIFIGRSGAMTCSEIAALGMPSILVPYPYASDNHQYYNALALADVGAAVICDDADFTPEYLQDAIIEFVNDKQRLAEMGRQAKSKRLPEATAEIYDALIKVIDDDRKKKAK